MADINRGAIALPTEVSSEILQKTQNESAVMRLARRVALPGRGLTIPMITGDPTAEWVAETGAKPVSNPTVNKKVMQAYKLAVIETFSEEFVRDAKALYDSLIARLPLALAAVFDGTVLGAVQAPGENFDSFSGCTAQSLIEAVNHSAYDGLVAADTDIAVHGGVLSGFALSAQARGILLAAKDSVGRPLFVNSAAQGAIPLILGVPAYLNKGLYKAGTAASGSGDSAVAAVPAVVGVAGDWTQAMYGTVEGVKIDINTKGNVTVGTGQNAVNINLWQQNMVAVRAEIEIGFRADTTVFNLLTGETPT